MPGQNLTRDEAADRAALLAVDAYEIQLDLTGSEVTFSSQTTVRFTARPGTSSFIDLIAPNVRSITLNGRELDPAQVFSDSRIALADLAEQNELRVLADCAYMNTGEGLHRFVDPQDGSTYLYTQFEVADARRVFAVFEQPDLKARFTWTVSTPTGWQVFSTSPTPEPTVQAGPHGEHLTWAFAPTPRLSPYVNAIVAGPYQGSRRELTLRDGRTISLGCFCRAALVEFLDADNVFDVTAAGFAHFEALFDTDYPFAKYDQLFVPEFNAGAMENAGCVTILEDYVFRSKPAAATVERRALTILHELAHMWFGDLVTMRWWDDLWLNESFAEYTSTRCQAEHTPWSGAWTTFLSSEKAWAYRQDQLSSTHPIVAPIRDLADVEVNFDGITYAKGASVLKQLVHYVGVDAFDAGLRAYFTKHAWQNTTLADLLAELEQTSGRDLSAWSASWLQTAGVATLRPEFSLDEQARITDFAVLQEAPADHPDLRAHRLKIAAYALSSDPDSAPEDASNPAVLHRLWSHEATIEGARTAIAELAGKPRGDILLVNDEDWAYAKIRLDADSMDAAVEYLDRFTDSLPATLIWAAAWDMTRDAELPARTFTELVLRHLPSVQDPSVGSTLLAQLSGALAYYLSPEHRDATRAHAVEGLLAQLKSAAAGSDRQLLLARAFAGQANSAEHLELIAAWLDGSAALPGFEVDTDMRWTLLTSLVAGGRAGEEEIAAELRRDDTASGLVRATTARAAIPTPQAKAATWQQVMHRTDLPNKTQEGMIRGFVRVHDEELLAAYVEPYFAALTEVWASRTSEMATMIVQGLFPTGIGTQAVVDRAQRWLDENASAEPSLRRLVAEGRDAVARAVKAQECDARR